MENVTDSITTTNNGKRKWKIIIDRQMWSQQRHGSQHAVTNGKRGVVGPAEEGDSGPFILRPHFWKGVEKWFFKLRFFFLVNHFF